jgi:hypothetical protein
VIQELAGHADLTMTQRYMHLSPAALADAIRLFDRPRAKQKFGDVVETGVGADRVIRSVHLRARTNGGQPSRAE